MTGNRRPASVVRDDRLAVSTPFAQWLAFGFTFDEETTRARVDRLEAAMVDWQAADAGAWASATQPDRDDYLARLLSDALRSAVPAADGMTLLSLSGGYDSRSIAARWPTDRLRAFTYGRPGALDFDTVRVIAQQNMLDVRLIDVRELEWERGRVLAELVAQRDRLLSPRSAVLPMLDAELGRTTIVSGFANDYLTGSRHRVAPTWEVAVLDFAQFNDAFGFQEALGHEACVALLPRRGWSDLIPFDVQLFSIRQWQRIRPSSTFARTMVLPFEDGRWCGFWLSREREERNDRSLWLAHLARALPEWFPELSEGMGERSARAALRLWLADHAPARDAGDPGPVKPTADHCWASDYRDNPSFRAFVDDSVSRLRDRQVFHDRFVEDRLREWRRGSRAGRRGIRGLVATELSLAGGLFDG